MAERHNIRLAEVENELLSISSKAFQYLKNGFSFMEYSESYQIIFNFLSVFQKESLIEDEVEKIDIERVMPAIEKLINADFPKSK